MNSDNYDVIYYVDDNESIAQNPGYLFRIHKVKNTSEQNTPLKIPVSLM